MSVKSTRSTSAASNQGSSSLDAEFDALPASAKKIVLFIREDLRSMKDELLALLDAKSTEISCLREEVKDLKLTVGRLEERIDDADCYERRDTLIVSGSAVPPGTPDEVCRNVVMGVFKDELKLNISSSDISTAHRVGKRPVTQSPDNRKIAVKLCRRDLKRDLLSSRRTLKPDGLFISESLTPVRNTIMFVLRKIRRAHPNILKGCTSIDGRVFAYVASDRR